MLVASLPEKVPLQDAWTTDSVSFEIKKSGLLFESSWLRNSVFSVWVLERVLLCCCFSFERLPRRDSFVECEFMALCR